MPQIGQFPGWSRMISGCIGQVYSVRAAGKLATTGSSGMPHFGQEPAPCWRTSGCIGQVYEPSGWGEGGGSVRFPRYLEGSASNFAKQFRLQKWYVRPSCEAVPAADDGTVSIPQTGSLDSPVYPSC